MATETNEKASGGKSAWFVLAGLVVANLLVGLFLAPRHIGLHHAPLIQFPNFLASFGVPGEWLPPHITFTWLVMGILVVFGWAVGRGLRAVPGPLQNFAEVVIEGFLGLLDQMIGRQGRQFLPLVGTAGLFILTSNLLANIPGFQPPTANWNTTIALALTVLAFNFLGDGLRDALDPRLRKD